MDRKLTAVLLLLALPAFILTAHGGPLTQLESDAGAVSAGISVPVVESARFAARFSVVKPESAQDLKQEDQTGLHTYQSGPYTYYGDADRVLEETVKALKASCAIIISAKSKDKAVEIVYIIP